MIQDDKRKEVYEWRNCVEDECGHKKFFISVAEKEYFDSRIDEETGKSFDLPKRCYACRVKRRKDKGPNHVEQN